MLDRLMANNERLKNSIHVDEFDIEKKEKQMDTLENELNPQLKDLTDVKLQWKYLSDHEKQKNSEFLHLSKFTG